VLTDVKVAIDVEGASVEMATINRMYPKQVWDIFAGEQIVIAGRYKKPGAAKVVISGKINGQEKKFDFPATLAEKSGDQSYAFVEKLWAMRRVGEIIDQLDLSGKNDELVKELVELSTKHGILTPYTSFLADDQAAPSSLASAATSFRRTNEALEQLREFDGRGGVAQRAEKKSFQYAENLDRFAKNAEAAAPAADAAGGPAPAGRGLGGGGFGGVDRARASLPRSSSGATYRDIKADKEVAAEGVRQAGQGEALYKRGNVLIAANAKDVPLDKAEDEAKIKTIKRFSEEYFKLVKANTAAENAILAQQSEGEELIVKLRGEVYRIK
jgi:Ca-activated chloride channel family protein